MSRRHRDEPHWLAVFSMLFMTWAILQQIVRKLLNL